MKILLISVNREKMPAPVFPLGLAYVARALRKEGHVLEVMDLCFSEDVCGQLTDLLQAFQPELIGFSLRNLDNLTYPHPISYLGEVGKVISLCRQSCSARLAMGGSGFSLAPGALFEHFDLDFGIVGEGEDVFPRMVRALERGEPVLPSPHLLVRGKALPSPIRGARTNSLSTPDRTPFQTGRYLREGGMLNLQTKRGCPFSCIYCTYPLLEGREVRLREPREAVEEIRQLVEEKESDYLYFVDDIFNYPPSHAEALCRAIVGSRLRVRWSAFVSPGFLNGDLLKWMKEAGCVGVEFGTDSGSSRMLRNYGKAFTVEDIHRASSLCASTGIHHCHYLLFGGPGEEESTIEESFQLMDHLNPTAVIAMLGVRIYPGTELERIALREKVLLPDSNLMYPYFYISPGVGERLEHMIRSMALERKQWIVPGLEINISQNLMESIRRFGIRGPLWELVARMKRPRIRPLGDKHGIEG